MKISMAGEDFKTGTAFIVAKWAAGREVLMGRRPVRSTGQIGIVYVKCKMEKLLACVCVFQITHDPECYGGRWSVWDEFEEKT